MASLAWVLVATAAVMSGGRAADDEAMTLCGRNLADARMLFCYQYGILDEKRGSGPRMIEHSDESWPSAEEVARRRHGWAWPWFVQAPRAHALPRPKRGSGGIVDECCFKPCTLNELLQYC